MTVDVKSKIQELRNFLNYHGHKYYVLDAPEITDIEYDMKMRELQVLEEENPQYDDPNSPSHRVGGVVISELKSAKLDMPMLSLDNAFNPEETGDAIKKMYQAAGLTFVDGELDLVVEPKLDGLAIENTYQGGELIASKTRGDGSVGEDVTHTTRTIKSLPLKLSNSEGIDRIQVRGEAFMPISSLEKFNAYAAENNLKSLANCRNGASGSIRQLDSKVAAKRNLDFIAYSVAEVDGDESLLPDSHFELLHFIGSLGFKINPLMKKISSLAEIEKYHDHILSIRDQIGYEIDGLVIKLDSRSAQEEAGYTNRAAKFAVARKLPAIEVETQIISADIATGRTGLIAPTANLKPTKIGGVTVSRATLHNFDIIKSKDVAIGDFVTLYKAGDVVPAIGAKLRNGENRIIIDEPTHCPSCGSPAIRDESVKDEKGGAHLYCTGGLLCDAQALNSLIHFSSKGCMNFDGVGDKLIEAMFEKGLVKTFSDFFKLTVSDISQLPRMGAKSAQKAIDSINKAKTIELKNFIASLGIRGIGESKAKNLALHFGDIQSVLAASESELRSVTDIGEVNSRFIKAWFTNEASLSEVSSLLDLGVEITEVEASGDELKGQTWVLTGTLTTMKRSEVKKFLESKGAKVSGTVSKKTSGVVYGEGAGGKLSDANELIAGGANIQLLTEENFLELFGLV